jgi:hypothetical protein
MKNNENTGSPKECHYVYRLTNMRNGVYYYGVRTCLGDPYNDPYMGSSTRIREEYKGRKKEFRKDIVSVQPTRSLAFTVEGILVNEWQLSQDKCLNARLGGVIANCSMDRQQAGIAKAKAAGKYKGGKKRKLTDEQLDELNIDFNAGIPRTEIAKKYGITREYVYKLVKINENSS